MGQVETGKVVHDGSQEGDTGASGSQVDLDNVPGPGQIAVPGIVGAINGYEHEIRAQDGSHASAMDR